MKIIELEKETVKTGRKSKKFKLDQNIVSKIGRFIYSQEEVNSVTIKVGFKNRTSVVFHRCEEDDDYEDFKRSRDEKGR